MVFRPSIVESCIWRWNWNSRFWCKNTEKFSFLSISQNARNCISVTVGWTEWKLARTYSESSITTWTKFRQKPRWRMLLLSRPVIEWPIMEDDLSWNDSSGWRVCREFMSSSVGMFPWCAEITYASQILVLWAQKGFQTHRNLSLLLCIFCLASPKIQLVWRKERYFYVYYFINLFYKLPHLALTTLYRIWPSPLWKQ